MSQTSVSTAANVLGTIGTVFWTIQLCPQIWRNYRTKSTEGVPASMMLLWSASGVPFGIYAILQKFNIPLQVQPQCFCVLCMISWGQCKFYGSKWPKWKAISACVALWIVFAALQILFVFVIRGPYSRGVSWPVLVIGIIAFLVLIAGYLPIPFELIKRRGRIVGIDLTFLTIDWFGAFFSLMSLVAQDPFDPLFGTLYSLCATIEMSMFASHGIWVLRTRAIRRRAKEADIAYDVFPEAIEWQEKGIKLNPRRMRTWRSKKDAGSRPTFCEREV